MALGEFFVSQNPMCDLEAGDNDATYLIRTWMKRVRLWWLPEAAGVGEMSEGGHSL